MKVSAVHFNPKIAPHLQHNDRTNLHSPNIHQELMNLNEYTKSAKDTLKEIDKLYKEAMEKLKGKKGKRTPKDRSYHEAIFEISQNTTLKQCQELADKIAELTGFRVLQIAIHRDEGHTNENGEFVTHHHAHAVFFTLDKDTGKQLARQEASLSKWNLSKMQDLASEILGMERGEKGSKKAYVSNYKDYKKIQQAKTEAKIEINNQEAEVKGLIIAFRDFKQQEEQKLKELKEKLAKKEQELALEAKNLSEERENLEKWQKQLKNEREALNQEIRKLNEAKQTFINRHKEEFQSLQSYYESKQSFFKNLITLGNYHKKLKKDYQRAEDTLIAKTSQIEKNLVEKFRAIADRNEILEKQISINQQKVLNYDKAIQENQELQKENNALHYRLNELRKPKQEQERSRGMTR